MAIIWLYIIDRNNLAITISIILASNHSYLISRIQWQEDYLLSSLFCLRLKTTFEIAFKKEKKVSIPVAQLWWQPNRDKARKEYAQ